MRVPFMRFAHSLCDCPTDSAAFPKNEITAAFLNTQSAWAANTPDSCALVLNVAQQCQLWRVPNSQQKIRRALSTRRQTEVGKLGRALESTVIIWNGFRA